MERFIKDDRTGISYELIGDYYFPCLAPPASPNIGKYGRMRWRYLKEHRQTLYSQLVLSDKLASHLEEIDQSASEMMERLIRDMAERQGVRNGTDLYCNRGYMVKDCECRQVVMKEPEADAVVLGELKRKLRRILDEEELRLERRADAPAAGSRVESLKNALEAAKKAKQRLFEKLADREIERAVFVERKKVYDAEIAGLEQEISDVELAERIERDADSEVRERADAARSFLDVREMTEEIWGQFVKGAWVYPDGRIEVRWNFGDEMEEDACL